MHTFPGESALEKKGIVSENVMQDESWTSDLLHKSIQTVPKDRG